ncbi:MAG: HAD hydrolase-like protein [Candidatus Nomurabacteria bacterium]|nr:HAD hydrolase-like protein [Candidatus Nomurabacteria bacterium]
MKTILIDAVYCFIIEKEEGKFEIFQDMFDLLETYSNNKIILTSASDDKRELFGLDKMPYEVFTLKHNPEKTDPEYYKTLLNKFSLNKDEVIYFEHNIEAVKSAQSIGINSYYYDNDKKDLEGLKNFLDKNLK